LAGSTADQLAEFQRRYVPNRNPEPASVSLLVDGEERPLLQGDPSSDENVVPAGASATLRVRWKACEQAPCEGAEPYVVFDPLQRQLQPRREAMRVAWFSTAGHLEYDRSGRDEGDLETFSDNVWLVPEVEGPQRLWVVLRDDRGGVGWIELHVNVKR
jgi:hypothetical protein